MGYGRTQRRGTSCREDPTAHHRKTDGFLQVRRHDVEEGIKNMELAGK